MRGTVSQDDLSGFLARLEAEGAEDVRRHPARRDGRIVVTWQPSERQHMRTRMLVYAVVLVALVATAWAFVVVYVLGR